MRRKRWCQASEGQRKRLEMLGHDFPPPLPLCPLLGYPLGSKAPGGFEVFPTGACPVLGLKPLGCMLSPQGHWSFHCHSREWQWPDRELRMLQHSGE